MSDVDVLPEVKEILGAVLFAAKQPVGLEQLHALFGQTAQNFGGVARDFADATEAVVRAGLDELRADLETRRPGLRLVEVAGGYRLETVPRCGPWLRQYLERGRPSRLSKPALETLAIVAYRQPCTRAEIEAVRGVAVDQILRNLLDLQLVRIAGRSEVPGRPWLFGTTQRFLEHFGLRNLDELPGVEELRRMEEARPGPAAAGEAGPAAGEPAGEEHGAEAGAGPAAAGPAETPAGESDEPSGTAEEDRRAGPGTGPAPE